MRYSLVKNQNVQICILVRKCGQKHLYDLFLGKWKLVRDLDHKLTDGLEVRLCEEVLNVELGLLEVFFLQRYKTLSN